MLVFQFLNKDDYFTDRGCATN